MINGNITEFLDKYIGWNEDGEAVEDMIETLRIAPKEYKSLLRANNLKNDTND